ncbi:MAG: magnesium transporter, partial [Sphaerochaetaceae bacterium]|nr:magnesium transporter [Sphaerochaetaceae bacterium]
MSLQAQLEQNILEIKSILNSDIKEDFMREQLDKYHDYEIAKALETLNHFEQKLLYKILPEKSLADVFEELTSEAAFLIIEETSLSVVSKIFKEMEVDDLVDIINETDDEEDRITYLSLIEPKKRLAVRKFLNFSEDLVGSIMNNSFIEISKTDSVKAAIKKVVARAPEVEYINNIYVTENDTLIGALSLSELINAGNDQTKPISDIMSENVISISVSADKETALVLMQNYDFQLLPVVDKYQKLIGIISFDDMINTLQSESEQDYSSLAALSEVSIDESETVFETIKKRMPWLIVLLFINLITSGIIAGYEEALIILPTLSIFMPLVLNMAGNTGTQSLGIVIRLFAKNELDNRKSVMKHLLNEFLTGVVNGLIIAAVLFLMVVLFNYIRGTDFNSGPRFALVISLSINIAIIVST